MSDSATALNKQVSGVSRGAVADHTRVAPTGYRPGPPQSDLLQIWQLHSDYVEPAGAVLQCCRVREAGLDTPHPAAIVIPGPLGVVAANPTFLQLFSGLEVGGTVVERLLSPAAAGVLPAGQWDRLARAALQELREAPATAER